MHRRVAKLAALLRLALVLRLLGGRHAHRRRAPWMGPGQGATPARRRGFTAGSIPDRYSHVNGLGRRSSQTIGEAEVVVARQSWRSISLFALICLTGACERPDAGPSATRLLASRLLGEFEAVMVLSRWDVAIQHQVHLRSVLLVPFQALEKGLYSAPTSVRARWYASPYILVASRDMKGRGGVGLVLSTRCYLSLGGRQSGESQVTRWVSWVGVAGPTQATDATFIEGAIDSNTAAICHDDATFDRLKETLQRKDVAHEDLLGGIRLGPLWGARVYGRPNEQPHASGTDAIAARGESVA